MPHHRLGHPFPSTKTNKNPKNKKTKKTNNKSQKKRKETKRKYDGVRKGLRLQMNNILLQFLEFLYVLVLWET